MARRMYVHDCNVPFRASISTYVYLLQFVIITHDLRLNHPVYIDCRDRHCRSDITEMKSLDQNQSNARKSC